MHTQSDTYLLYAEVAEEYYDKLSGSGAVDIPELTLAGECCFYLAVNDLFAAADAVDKARIDKVFGTFSCTQAQFVQHAIKMGSLGISSREQRSLYDRMVELNRVLRQCKNQEKIKLRKELQLQEEASWELQKQMHAKQQQAKQQQAKQQPGKQELLDGGNIECECCGKQRPAAKGACRHCGYYDPGLGVTTMVRRIK